MKKLILLSCLLVFTATLIGQSKWTFGASVQAGFTGQTDKVQQDYPNPLGDYTYSTASKLQPSMGGGVWLERRLAKRWGIYLGLDYLQANSFTRSKSASYTPAGAMNYFGQDDFSMRQHQLQLPLEVHFYLGRAEHSWRPFISAGAQGQYLLSQTTSTESIYGAGGESAQTYTYTNKTDLNPEYGEFRRIQMGINTGIGLAGERVSFSIRRTWAVGGQNNDFYNCGCYCGLGLVNSYCDYDYYGGGSFARQLQQTSLRFQYRLL